MVKLLKHTVSLDELELATGLAGLRLLQLADGNLPQEVEMIATCHGQYVPMTPEQIGVLSDIQYPF